MHDTTPTIAEIAAEFGETPTTLTITQALRQFSKLDPADAGLKPIKLGIISSFTFDFLINPIVASGYCEGFFLQHYNAPFGQHLQEMLNPHSALYAFAPEVVLVAIRLQDACPPVYEGFNALDAAATQNLLATWKRDLEQALKAVRAHCAAKIICTNYDAPAYPSLGLADAEAVPSQLAVIADANAWLRNLRQTISDLYIMDVDNLAARCGRSSWLDPRTWLWARSPIATAHHWSYAQELTRHLRAVTGRVRKVLALDCDNTLWGGVLGDVGMEGLELGQDFPGNAYLAFQKRALDLSHRGVVLVVASKNDHDAVLDVFEHHPDMVLRPEHIAYFAVSWDPKPANLRQAANTLNLGIDSFVFVDDHPVECAMMRRMLPEVLTVQLPTDPAHYASSLARLSCFDQLALGSEDRVRGSLYRAEAQRTLLKSSTDDLESFYRQLSMRVIIARNSPDSVARAAQLTQRTNQFNMTTIRRTAPEIRALMEDNSYDVYTLRLHDRFGDAGIVGMAVIMHDGMTDTLETFIMSCRVLGRTVEEFFFKWLAKETRNAGRAKLISLYNKTPKNTSFAKFYSSVGARLQEPAGDDSIQRWCSDLERDASTLSLPPWIDAELI